MVGGSHAVWPERYVLQAWQNPQATLQADIELATKSCRQLLRNRP
jgi:hypothetical protein